MAILASRPEGTAVLKGFVRAELVAESEERVDAEYEDIVDVFLQMSTEDILGLTEPIAAEAQAHLQAAMEFAVKWELHAWTSLQHRTKGVAPSVATLLEKKRKLSFGLRRSVGMAPRAEGGRKARYKWLSTWRRSWKMPKGSFRHLDMPSVVDMRRKVRTGPWFARCWPLRLSSGSEFLLSPPRTPKRKQGETLPNKRRAEQWPTIWGPPVRAK